LSMALISQYSLELYDNKKMGSVCSPFGFLCLLVVVKKPNNH